MQTDMLSILGQARPVESKHPPAAYLRMKEYVRLHSVRRAYAILIAISLLASPLALLARSNACAPVACARLCCLPRATHTPMKAAKLGMPCHHSGSAPPPLCLMKSACDHALDYGFASPLPPMTLVAAVATNGIQTARGILVTSSSRIPVGFHSPPFEPPRS
jgi:hypothetical protein